MWKEECGKQPDQTQHNQNHESSKAAGNIKDKVEETGKAASNIKDQVEESGEAASNMKDQVEESGEAAIMKDSGGKRPLVIDLG